MLLWRPFKKATPAYFENPDYKRLLNSPGFDKEFYCSQVSRRKQHPDPLQDYCTYGVRHELDPHPLFCTKYYLQQCPELKGSQINPLVHYLEKGALLGKNPHPLFDSYFYYNKYEDIHPSNPLESFLWHGGPIALRDPCPIFDSSYYLDLYPEVKTTGMIPVVHYIKVGASKNYKPHPIFDPDYYRREAGIENSSINPLVHFLRHGMKAGLQPSAEYKYGAMRFNGLERGKTLFIIGSSPQLNELTSEQMATISKFPTIGLNRTNYKFNLTYFLTHYYSEVMVAKKRQPDLQVINYRLDDYFPLLPGVETVRAVSTAFFGRPSKAFEPPVPMIISKVNAVITAVHFAFILGVKRIVFLGIEQNSSSYYFQYDQKILKEIISDYEIIKGIEVVDPCFSYSNYDELIRVLHRKPEDTAKEQFHHIDSAETLDYLFAELRREGVELISTKQDSVTVRVGAKYVPLEEVLASVINE